MGNWCNKRNDMKKPKLKLQTFEIKYGTELSPKFLSKILGGDDNFNPPPANQDSNAPEYSVSLTSSIEVETKDER